MKGWLSLISLSAEVGVMTVRIGDGPEEQCLWGRQNTTLQHLLAGGSEKGPQRK